MTAIYTKTLLPPPKIPSMTSFEIVYGPKPSVKHMRVFRCRAYILTPSEKRLKWDPKARVGTFMGYEEVSKAYRVFDIEAGQVVVTRDVNFDEAAFRPSMESSGEEVDDTMLNLDLLEINDDDVRQTNYKRIGKRKIRPSNNVIRPVYHQAGLEEESAPDGSIDRHQKSRSSAREKSRYDDEEEKEGISSQDDDSASPTFWHASDRGNRSG